MKIQKLWIPIMMLGVGCIGASEAAAQGDSAPADQAVTTSESSEAALATTPFQCLNKAGLQVACVGSIGVLPITVNVKNARILNNNELIILNNDLNNLAILDAGVLSGNDILEDVKVTVLDDFIALFKIPVSLSSLNVCTNVLGISFCG